MPRNPAGTYSLPNAPVVGGNTILATDENVTRDDIATELTDSLSRSGHGGMLAPFRISDGSMAVPGLGFISDVNTGIFRDPTSAARIGVSINGALLMGMLPTGVEIASGKYLRVQGEAPVTPPTSGAGVEIYYQTSGGPYGAVGAFDRATSQDRPLWLFGSEIRQVTGGTSRFVIDATGVANFQGNRVTGVGTIEANILNGNTAQIATLNATTANCSAFHAKSPASFVPSIPNGEAYFHSDGASGACLYGRGTIYDFSILNRALGYVLANPTGSLQLNFGGPISMPPGNALGWGSTEWITGATNALSFYTAGVLRLNITSSGTVMSTGPLWMQGGWQNPIFFGGNALWVDGAVKLRIKAGAPTFDTDGSLV